MEAAVPDVATQTWGVIVVKLLAYSIWLSVGAMTGRAIALTWRPSWHVAMCILLIACAVSFLRYALFGEVLLDARHFVVDVVALLVVGLTGFRLTRVAQMVGCYGWINERTGAFRWRRRAIHSSESG